MLGFLGTRQTAELHCLEKHQKQLLASVKHPAKVHMEFQVAGPQMLVIGMSLKEATDAV